MRRATRGDARRCHPGDAGPCHAGDAVSPSRCRVQVRVRRKARIAEPPRPPTLPAMAAWPPASPPGQPTRSVIHFAIGRGQATITDRNEQSVIGRLQFAPAD